MWDPVQHSGKTSTDSWKPYRNAGQLDLLWIGATGPPWNNAEEQHDTAGMLRYKINTVWAASQLSSAYWLFKKQPQPEIPAYPHLSFREDTLSCRLPPQLILPKDSEGLEHTSSRDGLMPLHWCLHLKGGQTPVDNHFPTLPAPKLFYFFLKCAALCGPGHNIRMCSGLCYRSSAMGARKSILPARSST